MRSVDKGKLERAEELLKKKQTKKETTGSKQPSNRYGNREATASQVLSKSMMSNGNTSKVITLHTNNIQY